MSFVKDVLGFEKFNLKDMWKKVKDDPKRMLVGAVDPFSTRMWNQTGMGKDWEPIVDQMGGAYGGSAFTLGDTGEGVYGRAREAGVPTKAGSQMHDLAHVIASIYAGGYGGDKLASVAPKFSNVMGKMPKGGFDFGGGQQPTSMSRPAYRSAPQVPLIAPGEGPAVMGRRTRPNRNQLMAEAMMRRV